MEYMGCMVVKAIHYQCLLEFSGKREPEYQDITSGDFFTITTPDPGHLPLPSWSLLELLWNLQRITGMSMAPCVTAMRRTADFHRWLGLFRGKEEFEQVQQTAIQVYSLGAP